MLDLNQRQGGIPAIIVKPALDPVQYGEINLGARRFRQYLKHKRMDYTKPAANEPEQSQRFLRCPNRSDFKSTFDFTVES